MPRFKKYAKKLPRHLQQIILDAVEEILTNTEIGEHNALRANFIKTLTGLTG
jgi:mRNA-degrading endonuclease RelE of RelBE toxin-antitoxin system